MVKVFCSCGWLLPLTRREIQAALSAMLACSPQPEHPVEVYVVRDGSMAHHNQRCLGCTGPTNVLSFPACPSESLAASLDAAYPATIVLSADTLNRECFLYGQNPREHLLRLLAHGMGHVMGLDHGPDMDVCCDQFFAAGRAAV